MERVTPGHNAYLEDCAKRPNYHTGEPRKTWEQLGEPERNNWETVTARINAELEVRGYEAMLEQERCNDW